MIWFSPHRVYGYVTLDTWLFHVQNHTTYVNLQSMVGEGDICPDFDASSVAFAVCQSCSIPVWGSDILGMMLCCGWDYTLVL